MSKSKNYELKPIDFLNNPPNVLLFGNGLSRNTGGESTEDLITNLCKENKVLYDDIKSESFPMQVILASKDNVDGYCDELSKKMSGKEFYKNKDLSLIKLYMNLNFDAFLTTNYSYEAEYSLVKNLSKCAVHNSVVKRRESKYFLYSYYKVPKDTGYCDIWHIHGEAKNKSSIVIGQYYYGNLVHKYIDYLSKQKRFASVDVNEKIIAKSWIDYFIFGDVYIVGLSLSFSEFDLWWLLNRKKNEKYIHGKVYYFLSKKDDVSNSMKKMLDLYEVEIIEDKSGICTNDEDYYNKFYKWIYDFLKNKLEEK